MRLQFLGGLPDLLEQCLYFLIIIAALGVVSFVIGESIPRKWYHYDAFPFTPFAWEKNGQIYEKIGIRKWKDRVPDISKLVWFVVGKRVNGLHDVNNMRRLIQETCSGEMVHIGLALVSPAFMILMPGGYGAVAMALYAVANILFAAIQRYNRPRLAHMLNRLIAKQDKNKGDTPCR